MIDRPETPEEMRDLFRSCADVVRRFGKGGVPISSLALAYGLVWTEFSDEEAAAFFDHLAGWWEPSPTGPTVLKRRPANHRNAPRRRFRAWFS
jgi:hypothetical protein